MNTTHTTLADWIPWAFVPAKRRLDEHSYQLKHRAERGIGVYVNEDDFKAAMLAAGHQPLDVSRESWYFRVAFKHPLRAYGNPW